MCDCSLDNIPHVPLYENSFFLATDHNTRKYKNLKQNNNVALGVWWKLEWVRQDPWNEGEAPFEIMAAHKSSWGPE